MAFLLFLSLTPASGPLHSQLPLLARCSLQISECAPLPPLQRGLTRASYLKQLCYPSATPMPFIFLSSTSHLPRYIWLLCLLLTRMQIPWEQRLYVWFSAESLVPSTIPVAWKDVELKATQDNCFVFQVIASSPNPLAGEDPQQKPNGWKVHPVTCMQQGMAAARTGFGRSDSDLLPPAVRPWNNYKNFLSIKCSLCRK